jgi:hypothetical protein
VFVDNAGGQRCYCDACQAGFRDWAASRYSPEEIQRRFHVGRADEVRLAVGRREIDLPWVETKRFWVETARRQQALIRAAGEAVVGKGKFYVFPNGANNSPHWVRDAFADCDWVMSENSGSYIGAYGTHPGADRSGHGPCAPPGEDGRRGRDAVRTGQGAKEGAVGGRRRIRHDPRPELLDLHGVPRVRHLAKKKPPAAFPEREERGSGAGGRGRGAKGGGGRPR